MFRYFVMRCKLDSQWPGLSVSPVVRKRAWSSHWAAVADGRVCLWRSTTMLVTDGSLAVLFQVFLARVRLAPKLSGTAILEPELALEADGAGSGLVGRKWA